MRFNKSISNNPDDDNQNDNNNTNDAMHSSLFLSQTYTTTSDIHEISLAHIDTVKVDEKSRLVLTKKARDILHIQPKDTVVIYHDRVNNHVILKVQRGINNNIVDSWILKRNIVVGHMYDRSKEDRQSSNTNILQEEHQLLQEQKQKEHHTKPFNIMLVDDEPDVLLTLKTIISSQGYNVEAFANSQDALKQFLQITNTINNDSNVPYYKLVITDIRMQGLNGVQFYQILKALNKNVKVLFISGLDSAQEIISVLPNVSSNDIIRKPIDADSLSQIIQNALLS